MRAQSILVLILLVAAGCKQPYKPPPPPPPPPGAECAVIPTAAIVAAGVPLGRAYCFRTILFAPVYPPTNIGHVYECWRSVDGGPEFADRPLTPGGFCSQVSNVEYGPTDYYVWCCRDGTGKIMNPADLQK